ncbi:MAG: enoyl-CoA hydratase-related protein [Actinomycetota bacterium]
MATSTTTAVDHHLDDGVLVVTLDDGERNALRPTTLAALQQALDHDADAVVLTGRPGVLTAGLDVKWMAEHGRQGTAELLVALGRCLMAWWTHPRPTVCGAPGHAIAAGSLLAMACDHAVAAHEGYWGLTETRIDFELPSFALALARANLRTDRLEDLLLPGERVDAATAVEAGFADELAAPDETLTRATDRARHLAGLPPRAYARTKQRLRAEPARTVLDHLEADVDEVVAHLDDGPAS